MSEKKTRGQGKGKKKTSKLEGGSDNFSFHKRAAVDNDKISPSWFFDMSQNQIAKHPVRSRRVRESEIPSILTSSRYQLIDKSTACSQPNWHLNCI